MLHPGMALVRGRLLLLAELSYEQLKFTPKRNNSPQQITSNHDPIQTRQTQIKDESLVE